ncbi:desmoglein-2-like protein [Cololabis saira]|uniref:desmoglein-2-like protein n=1 Tax=Cololabis saira TaxID=129043 RepID=UPI002AD43EEE|nr:desmoglein-2-like protein [Cololabis saira]
MSPLLKWSVFVGLGFPLIYSPVEGEGNGQHLQRKRREWILAPRPLYENQDYTTYDFIAKIRSDKENNRTIHYYLTGPGADQHPVGRFTVDRVTGFVRVHAILDREEIALYELKGVAKFANSNTNAENDVDVRIKVLDVNDCAPVIISKQVGYVNESSAAGTYVMRVIATDADEENTAHSKITYKIDSQSDPARMFSINSKTGEVKVTRNTLDRETKDTYRLKIIVTDMDGSSIGNSGTGEIEIKLLDINDNIPYLEQQRYEVSVKENTLGLVESKIRAVDMDIIHTDNWLAVYEIVSGNEAGYFSITTNKETNEAIIMVQKELDYEELKTVNLGVRVSNKAKYNFGSAMTGAASSKTYQIKVNVENEKEGPRFQPSTKVVVLSEDKSTVSINKVITTYAAIDSDTLQTATNVRYVKLYDADNWLIIDEKTAEIKLNKLPDRESKYLINGTYYAKIICVTNESPSQSATGTIAIQVEDFNDHCPELTIKNHTMCFESNAIFVTASDKDEFPNSAPFDFTVIEESEKQKWIVEPVNGTTVILRHQEGLWPGIYKVAVNIKDQQGKSCDRAQVIDLTVCTCNDGTKTCLLRRGSGASFGAPGVLLLLLGLLLLLLVPLLLMFCLCGAAARDFKPIPFETKQHLIAYHTEGQGEDKDVPLVQVPLEVDSGAIHFQNTNTFDCLGGLIESDGAGGGGAMFGNGMNTSTLTTKNMYQYNQYGQYGQNDMDYVGSGMAGGQDMSFTINRREVFDGMALSSHFLEDYYSNKSQAASQQVQEMDRHQIYNYEGDESLAGSVGCCSLLENDDDLTFLNDLGPKFKTLAEICKGSTLVSESAGAGVSVAPVRPVSPVRPSTSTHTHVHTHTETVRDRDRVNLTNLSASNVATGSSTVFKGEKFMESAQSSATVPRVHIQDNVAVPNQTLLIQQPAVYYTATPMYVVESKPQMVYVSGGSQQAVGQMGQVGLSQGMLQVGGLQTSQGMVLVDGQVGMGGATGQVVHGLSQGTLSRSTQVVMVEEGSSGAEQGTHLAQHFVQAGQGSTEGSLELGGAGAQVKTFSLGTLGAVGSNEDAETATAKLQGSQRVIMQHKKVTVTERKI